MASNSTMIATGEDQALVRASLGGDREAFGQLVRRYQERLYPTLLRLVGSPDDARDLLQEAFIRAYRKLDRFLGESSFYTWLYRIAVNLALSQRRRHHPVCVPFSQELRPESVRAVESDDPSRPLERAEQESQIQEALNELHEDHRAVVVLKDLDGLRYDEIAELLEIPIGTVRSRLHRARCELRDRLRHLVDTPEQNAAVPASTPARFSVG